MKGLTNEEARLLHEATEPLDEHWLTDAEEDVYEELAARGLVVEVALPPDDVGDVHMYEATPLGLIALRVHRASRALSQVTT